MQRFASLAVLGAVFFIIFLILFLPARLAFDQLARPLGVNAGLVHGSVWNTQIIRASYGSIQIREITSRLNPMRLMSGAASFDFTAEDRFIQATGTLAAGFKTIDLMQIQAAINLDIIPAYVGSGLSPNQSVFLDIDQIVLGMDAQCYEAKGLARSAVLVSTGERFGIELPMLEGRWRCAGETLVLDISGSSDELDLDGVIRFTPSGQDWQFEARSSDRDIITALSMLGFEQEGSLYTARSQGY